MELGVVQTDAAQQSVVSGHVRLSDGQPEAGVQVALFNVTNLAAGAVARATPSEAGSFVLSLEGQTGRSRPHSGFALGPNYPNPLPLSLFSPLLHRHP